MLVITEGKDFFTKQENGSPFKIYLEDCIELTDVNLKEASDKAAKLPKDAILYKGGSLDIKIFTTEQITLVKGGVQNILSAGIAESLNHGHLIISRHIIEDYLFSNQDELVKRGFSPDHKELTKEIYYTLYNCHSIIKAQVKFNNKYQSEPKLTYTILGEYNGQDRSLSFCFQDMSPGSGVKVATILHIN